MTWSQFQNEDTSLQETRFRTIANTLYYTIQQAQKGELYSDNTLPLYQMLRDNFFSIESYLFSNLGEQALNATHSCTDVDSTTQLIKISLACFTLAYLKNTTDRKAFDKITKEIPDLVSNRKLILNGYYNQPYSKELSNIEKQIAFEAYVTNNLDILNSLATFYYYLAKTYTYKPCFINDNFNYERQAYMDFSMKGFQEFPGNDIYLMKSASYSDLVARVYTKPSTKNALQFNITKLLKIHRIISCQQTNPKLDQSIKQALNAIIERINKLLENPTNIQDQHVFEIENQLSRSEFKESRELLSRASNRESDIIQSLNVSATITNISLANNEAIIQLQERFIKNDKISESEIHQIQLYLDELHTTKLNSSKRNPTYIGKKIKTDDENKYFDCMDKIKNNEGLHQVYQTIFLILYSHYVGVLGSSSNRLADAETWLGKIGNIVGDIHTIGKVIGFFLKKIDEKMIENENKNISSALGTPDEAKKIIRKFALVFAITYESEIQELSTTPETSAKLITTPPGTIAFATLIAAYAVQTLARGNLQVTDTTDQKVNNLIISVQSQTKNTGAKVKNSFSNQISKSNFLSILIGEEGGLVKLAKGGFKRHLGLLEIQIVPIKISDKISIEEVCDTIEQLSEENEELSNQNSHLTNHNINLTKTVIKLSDRLDTVSDQLATVMEYLKRLSQQCGQQQLYNESTLNTLILQMNNSHLDTKLYLGLGNTHQVTNTYNNTVIYTSASAQGNAYQLNQNYLSQQQQPLSPYDPRYTPPQNPNNQNYQTTPTFAGQNQTPQLPNYSQSQVYGVIAQSTPALPGQPSHVQNQHGYFNQPHHTNNTLPSPALPQNQSPLMHHSGTPNQPPHSGFFSPTHPNYSGQASNQNNTGYGQQPTHQFGNQQPVNHQNPQFGFKPYGY